MAQLKFCWHFHCKPQFQSLELWLKIISRQLPLQGSGKGEILYLFLKHMLEFQKKQWAAKDTAV